MDLFPLLVNPRSLHQTVENFFDFSFRVKQGVSHLKLDANGMPATAVTDLPSGALQKSQIVISLTQANVAQLAEAWNITEPGVPNRTFVDTSGASSSQGGAAAASQSGRGRGGRGRR